MPTFEVTAPNGKTYQVTGPEGSTKEQALAQVQKKLGGKKEEATLGHKAGAVIDSAAQALTANFSDEIAAGLKTGFGYIGDYEKAKAEEQARMEENRRLAPGYSLAGTVLSLAAPAGMAVKGLGAATKIAGGLNRAKAVVKAAGTNAAIGAGYGTASRIGDDQEIDPLTDAAIGIGAGAAGKVAGTVAGKLFNKSDTVKRANRRDEAVQESKDAFQAHVKGDIPVDPRVLEGVEKALLGPTKSVKGLPAARASRVTVKDLQNMVKPTPAVVDKGGIGFTQKITPREVTPASPAKDLQMVQVNELLRVLNKGAKSAGADKARTLAAKKILEGNLERVTPKKWADAEGARKMYSNVKKATDLRKKVMAVKNVEGINRILEDDKLMMGVSDEVKQMLKDARKDPSAIRKVVEFISRMSPTTIMFNALRGNQGLAAAQASMYGVGRLSNKKFSDELFKKIDDNYYKKPLEPDVVPDLEPVGALVGTGILGNFGE